MSLLVNRLEEFAGQLQDQASIGAAATPFDRTKRIVKRHFPLQRRLSQHAVVDSFTNGLVERTIQQHVFSCLVLASDMARRVWTEW